MTGLVWKDTLLLSYPQWGALLALPMLSLVWRQRRTSALQDAVFLTSALLALYAVFSGAKIGIDIQTTWNVLPRLCHPGWLSEIGFVNYLRFQPPLWTWWLRLYPYYEIQQGFSLAGGALLLGMAYRSGGKALAGSFLACPLFLLLTVLPTNDWWATVFLSVAVYVRQRIILSSLALCLACTLKYTSYVMLPVLFVFLPVQTLLAVCWIVGYWWWALSLDLFWPREQRRYLLHALSFGKLNYYVSARQASRTSSPLPFLSGIWRTLRWRWVHLGQSCLPASVWFLFPLYLRAPLWWGIPFAGLCLGYGNIKYLSLLFPLCFLCYVKNFSKTT